MATTETVGWVDRPERQTPPLEPETELRLTDQAGIHVYFYSFGTMGCFYVRLANTIGEALPSEHEAAKAEAIRRAIPAVEEALARLREIAGRQPLDMTAYANRVLAGPGGGE